MIENIGTVYYIKVMAIETLGLQLIKQHLGYEA